MAAPSLTDGNLATGGLPYVVDARLGATAGRILLAAVAIAIFVCTLACQTSGARMMFSMARRAGAAVPRAPSARSRRAPARRSSPRSSSASGAALVLVVNSDQSAVFPPFPACASPCFTWPTSASPLPLLVHASVAPAAQASGHRGAADEDGKPLFSLGSWGIPVNVVAVAYQVVMVVNLAWPRASVYDLTGRHLVAAVERRCCSSP